MISVTKTNDLGYIESVLSTPGMNRLCGGKMDRDEIHRQVNSRDNIFFVAIKDGMRMGFISFKNVTDGVAEIHVAIKTRGQDTVDAVKEAIGKIGPFGFSTVLAAYHPSRRSVDVLAQKIGFEHVDDINFNGEMYKIRKLNV